MSVSVLVITFVKQKSQIFDPHNTHHGHIVLHNKADNKFPDIFSGWKYQNLGI